METWRAVYSLAEIQEKTSNLMQAENFGPIAKLFKPAGRPTAELTARSAIAVDPQ